MMGFGANNPLRACSGRWTTRRVVEGPSEALLSSKLVYAAMLRDCPSVSRLRQGCGACHLPEQAQGGFCS